MIPTAKSTKAAFEMTKTRKNFYESSWKKIKLKLSR